MKVRSGDGPGDSLKTAVPGTEGATSDACVRPPNRLLAVVVSSNLIIDAFQGTPLAPPPLPPLLPRGPNPHRLLAIQR
ncbi:hypothetical protein E1B28_010548 [Marasmius oreades]|uniref:Uncharacterized protein n=1 Tax=Marasmius oreades TaxID=181124 RepID=A0A9P7UTS0_9AGAR|nr:uncharacterized protein E1B28_010548 [Marasmius oreades]KAG7091519.1 hypothetical protein E1B28_010548 [Marasmius oreades]